MKYFLYLFTIVFSYVRITNQQEPQVLEPNKIVYVDLPTDGSQPQVLRFSLPVNGIKALQISPLSQFNFISTSDDKNKLLEGTDKLVYLLPTDLPKDQVIGFNLTITPTNEDDDILFDIVAIKDSVELQDQKVFKNFYFNSTRQARFQFDSKSMASARTAQYQLELSNFQDFESVEFIKKGGVSKKATLVKDTLASEYFTPEQLPVELVVTAKDKPSSAPYFRVHLEGFSAKNHADGLLSGKPRSYFSFVGQLFHFYVDISAYSMGEENSIELAGPVKFFRCQMSDLTKPEDYIYPVTTDTCDTRNNTIFFKRKDLLEKSFLLTVTFEPGASDDVRYFSAKLGVSVQDIQVNSRISETLDLKIPRVYRIRDIHELMVNENLYFYTTTDSVNLYLAYSNIYERYGNLDEAVVRANTENLSLIELSVNDENLIENGALYIFLTTSDDSLLDPVDFEVKSTRDHYFQLPDLNERSLNLYLTHARTARIIAKASEARRQFFFNSVASGSHQLKYLKRKPADVKKSSIDALFNSTGSVLKNEPFFLDLDKNDYVLLEISNVELKVLVSDLFINSVKALPVDSNYQFNSIHIIELNKDTKSVQFDGRAQGNFAVHVLQMIGEEGNKFSLNSTGVAPVEVSLKTGQELNNYNSVTTPANYTFKFSLAQNATSNAYIALRTVTFTKPYSLKMDQTEYIEMNKDSLLSFTIARNKVVKEIEKVRFNFLSSHDMKSVSVRVYNTNPGENFIAQQPLTTVEYDSSRLGLIKEYETDFDVNQLEEPLYVSVRVLAAKDENATLIANLAEQQKIVLGRTPQQVEFSFEKVISKPMRFQFPNDVTGKSLLLSFYREPVDQYFIDNPADEKFRTVLQQGGPAESSILYENLKHEFSLHVRSVGSASRSNSIWISGQFVNTTDYKNVDFDKFNKTLSLKAQSTRKYTLSWPKPSSRGVLYQVYVAPKDAENLGNVNEIKNSGVKPVFEVSDTSIELELLPNNYQFAVIAEDTNSGVLRSYSTLKAWAGIQEISYGKVLKVVNNDKEGFKRIFRFTFNEGAAIQISNFNSITNYYVRVIVEETEEVLYNRSNIQVVDGLKAANNTRLLVIIEAQELINDINYDLTLFTGKSNNTVSLGNAETYEYFPIEDFNRMITLTQENKENRYYSVEVESEGGFQYIKLSNSNASFTLSDIKTDVIRLPTFDSEIGSVNLEIGARKNSSRVFVVIYNHKYPIEEIDSNDFQRYAIANESYSFFLNLDQFEVGKERIIKFTQPMGNPVARLLNVTEKDLEGSFPIVDPDFKGSAHHIRVTRQKEEQRLLALSFNYDNKNNNLNGFSIVTFPQPENTGINKDFEYRLNPHAPLIFEVQNSDILLLNDNIYIQSFNKGLHFVMDYDDVPFVNGPEDFPAGANHMDTNVSYLSKFVIDNNKLFTIKKVYIAIYSFVAREKSEKIYFSFRASNDEYYIVDSKNNRGFPLALDRGQKASVAIINSYKDSVQRDYALYVKHYEGALKGRFRFDEFDDHKADFNKLFNLDAYNDTNVLKDYYAYVKLERSIDLVVELTAQNTSFVGYLYFSNQTSDGTFELGDSLFTTLSNSTKSLNATASSAFRYEIAQVTGENQITAQLQGNNLTLRTADPLVSGLGKKGDLSVSLHGNNSDGSVLFLSTAYEWTDAQKHLLHDGENVLNSTDTTFAVRVNRSNSSSTYVIVEGQHDTDDATFLDLSYHLVPVASDGKCYTNFNSDDPQGRRKGQFRYARVNLNQNDQDYYYVFNVQLASNFTKYKVFVARDSNVEIGKLPSEISYEAINSKTFRIRNDKKSDRLLVSVYKSFLDYYCVISSKDVDLNSRFGVGQTKAFFLVENNKELDSLSLRLDCNTFPSNSLYLSVSFVGKEYDGVNFNPDLNKNYQVKVSNLSLSVSNFAEFLPGKTVEYQVTVTRDNSTRGFYGAFLQLAEDNVTEVSEYDLLRTRPEKTVSGKFNSTITVDGLAEGASYVVGLRAVDTTSGVVYGFNQKRVETEEGPSIVGGKWWLVLIVVILVLIVLGVVFVVVKSIMNTRRGRGDAQQPLNEPINQ